MKLFSLGVTPRQPAFKIITGSVHREISMSRLSSSCRTFNFGRNPCVLQVACAAPWSCRVYFWISPPHHVPANLWSFSPLLPGLPQTRHQTRKFVTNQHLLIFSQNKPHRGQKYRFLSWFGSYNRGGIGGAKVGKDQCASYPSANWSALNTAAWTKTSMFSTGHNIMLHAFAARIENIPRMPLLIRAEFFTCCPCKHVCWQHWYVCWTHYVYYFLRLFDLHAFPPP